MPMLPEPQGLYDPAFEHDACGVSFVVDMKGRRSHDIVDKGIAALCHLEHRGAQGAETNTGDGAGILLQVPDRFLRAVVAFDLPLAGSYATGVGFLPQDAGAADDAAAAIEAVAASEGFTTLGWRDVPHDDSMLGSAARAVEPTLRMPFFTMPAPADGAPRMSGIELERRAFILRKRIEHEVEGVYFPSLSCRTLIYKGMLTTPQLTQFYPELTDERMDSALALVHSRFSTNTFPSWPL